MTDHYQRIGAEAMVVAATSVQKLLVYSEVADGVISADVFFQTPQDSLVNFRFAPDGLRDLIYEFWERGAQGIAPRSWAAMRFTVDGNGHFAADLIYPDQFTDDEDVSDRRPRVVAELFPGAQVDYSRPRG
jgi:hypothetical protein